MSSPRNSAYKENVANSEKTNLMVQSGGSDTVDVPPADSETGASGNQLAKTLANAKSLNQATQAGGKRKRKSKRKSNKKRKRKVRTKKRKYKY
jgi:hypothetical protein